jgi:hypothetical protein
MVDRFRRYVTFANVVSLLALFVAVSTGGAYAANTVFSTDIVDGQVKTPDLAGLAVTAAKLGPNSVTSAKIQNKQVLNVDLADDAVTTDKVTNGAIGASDIGSSAVGQDEIATDGVAASEIADNSIDAGEIVDNSLGANDLAAGSVGTSELAANVVDSGKVVNNSLTTADVAGTDSNGLISLGAGSVANGRCRDFDITVGGAHANEVVVISLRGAVPEGVLIYGTRVPADGHATMKTCNFTGGAFPALVDVPIRTITFG